MSVKAKAETAPLLDKDALIAASQHFGTLPEIMAGALYNIKGPITEEQARAELKSFLNRPVK